MKLQQSIFIFILIVLTNLTIAQSRVVISLSYDECSACYSCPIQTIDYINEKDSTIKIDLLLPDTSAYTRDFLLEKYIGEENLDYYTNKIINKVFADSVLFNRLNTAPRSHFSFYKDEKLLLNIPIILFYNEKEDTYAHLFGAKDSSKLTKISLQIDTVFRTTIGKKYSAITNKLIYASKERLIAYNVENSKQKLILISKVNVSSLNIGLVVYNQILEQLNKAVLDESQFEKLSKLLDKERSLAIDVNCVGNLTKNGKIPFVGRFYFLVDNQLNNTQIVSFIDTNLQLDIANTYAFENKLKLSKGKGVFYLNCGGISVFDQGLLSDFTGQTLHLKGYNPAYLKGNFESINYNYFPVSHSITINEDKKGIEFGSFDETNLPNEFLLSGIGYFNNALFYVQLGNGKKYLLFENQKEGYLYNLENKLDSIKVLKNPVGGYIYEIAALEDEVHIIYSQDNVVTNDVFYSINPTNDRDKGVENSQNFFNFKLPIDELINPTFKINSDGIYILSIDLRLKNKNAVVYRLSIAK